MKPTKEQQRIYSKRHYEKYRNQRIAQSIEHYAKRKLREPERIMWLEARRRAKRDNLDFNIDVSDIKIPELCPVMLIPLVSSTKRATRNSPTLDRVDNTKGYIKGNIRVISHVANRCKGSMKLDEIHRLYLYSIQSI